MTQHIGSRQGRLCFTSILASLLNLFGSGFYGDGISSKVFCWAQWCGCQHDCSFLVWCKEHLNARFWSWNKIRCKKQLSQRVRPEHVLYYCKTLNNATWLVRRAQTLPLAEFFWLSDCGTDHVQFVQCKPDEFTFANVASSVTSWKRQSNKFSGVDLENLRDKSIFCSWGAAVRAQQFSFATWDASEAWGVLEFISICKRILQDAVEDWESLKYHLDLGDESRYTLVEQNHMAFSRNEQHRVDH